MRAMLALGLVLLGCDGSDGSESSSGGGGTGIGGAPGGGGSIAGGDDADDVAGRTQMPALHGGDVLGTACGSETLVTIRDSGAFMDPRSEADWWQGHP